MLIGIDASRATRPQRTGTENYSLHLLRHLLATGGGHRFRLYFNQPPPPDLFPGGDWEMRAIPLPRLWTHLRLSWEVMRHGPDVLFVPAHVIPLLHPASSVATLHDLGYLKYPQAHPRFQRLYLDWGTRWNAHVARHLIADSQATKLDLVVHYRIPAEKITVVSPGVHLSPASPREIAGVRSRYRLPENYILFVGTLQPRKNLPTLFQAYRDLARPNGTDYQLVLAGKRGWLFDGVLRHIEALGLSDRIRLLDYVPSQDLPGLLGGARLLVQPSLYEGFGLTLLEAMAVGVPVVTSNAAALPEVAGDAAILVNPRDVDAWREALRQALTDEALRQELILRGTRRVDLFSWERCARETLTVLERVGGGR